ncbi:MAG: ribonuclease HI [Bacteroidota bacterium]|nr:ribonuclease HI [Bacteroidota bacterium]
MQIEIHTDGACSGNPGPGGYGIVMKYGKHQKELSRGFHYTTNNRMELLAVIIALEEIKIQRLPILVITDSKYVMNAVEKKWLFEWEKKNFKGKKNADLWKRFIKIYAKLQVKFRWVKGHAGNPMNERCDKLAVTASKWPTEKDIFFEKSIQEK